MNDGQPQVLHEVVGDAGFSVSEEDAKILREQQEAAKREREKSKSK